MNLKRLIILIGCLAIIKTSFAWGKTGHNIVAQIAWRLLNDSVRNKVQIYLGKTTFEEAANWINSMRSNSDYDFMKPWHYLDFEQGQFYSRPPTDDNIITRLSLSYSDLKHYKLLCDDQVKSDILYIFHLIGDLHQPLHTGYSSDKGGNNISVDFMHTHTNLHKVWDDLIIDSNYINDDTCLQLLNSISPSQLTEIKNISFVS